MNESDFLIEPYPLVKAGGQHVTTTRSAFQVTHIPTLTVICSHERSQVRNKNFAVDMINNALEKLKYDLH
jgi:protein subunit release factor A